MRIKPWKKVVVATVVVAASIGAGAAWASQSQDPTGQEGNAAPRSAGDTRSIGTGINDVKFVPVTPCRLADTRVSSQRFANGQVRTFDVRGNEATFAAQGGKTGGCGIPGSITAVEITVSAVGASDDGFLRIYPDAVPTASFLSFNGTSSSSNTGTVSVCGHAGAWCAANNDLTVKAYGAGTDVVIDISGYYARPMAGVIKADASLRHGSRITNVARSIGVGTYVVTFDRDVSKCVPLVTSQYYGFIINALPKSGNANAMFVKTVRDDNSASDADFNIEVVC